MGEVVERLSDLRVVLAEGGFLDGQRALKERLGPDGVSPKQVMSAEPKLPGAGQAAVVAEAQLNLRWTAPALAQVADHKLLEQATRQVEAANGTPVRWIVAEKKLEGALRKMFEGAELPIEVVHVPPTPPSP